MANFSILLVDDNPTSLKLLRAIFEGDYEVASANDGLEALEILLQNKIDLVVTDVLMPNMDGYHLCYRVRTNPKLKDIPIVIYTATYVSLSEAKIAIEMGASYYLRKPTPGQTLLSAVRDILDNPKAFPHKIPKRRESTGMMQQYSAKLIAKLEQNNIDLEAAKNRIEQREKYFRALVENDYSMTVLMNEKFETTYRSPSSQTVLGWTAEEMEKLAPDEIVHPEDREHQRVLMRAVMENPGVMVPVITRLKHKNGTYRWLEGVSINKLSDPDIAGIITNLHDVTNSKLDEQNLKRAAATLKEAQSVGRMGSWQVDFVSNTHSWSDEMFAIFGYATNEIAATMEAFLSLVHPEDLALVSARVEQAFSSLENASFEFRFINKSGSVRHGYSKSQFEFDTDGKPLRLYGIVQDITEKKESEAKLVASEQRFRALIENSSDAIVLNNEHFVLLYQSPSVTRILGYTFEERRGTPSIDYVYPEDRQGVEKVYKDAAANPGRPIPFQNRFKHRNGHYVWLEGTLTNLLGDSNVKAYVANYRDITARKKTEDDLALILRRFEQAQQIAHLGNWELDLVTLKINWSAEMFRIYGLEPYSVEPSTELFLSLVHPDDLERMKAVIPQARQALKPFSFHHRIVYPSGNIRHLFTVGRYEFIIPGEPATLNGISLDVTELVEKESKLKQANQELATFIYKAYHDLRSPIVTILGLVNIANRDISDKLSLVYFSMINGIAEKQNKMLLSLINVMSIREHVPVITTVDLNRLLTDVLDSLKDVEGFEKVEFKINCNGKVQTDVELVFKIIHNIVENTIVFRDHNRPSRVVISSLEDIPGNLTFEIADNGIGISDKVMPRVYELFFRGSDLSKGPGLGLYVVKNAVEKLGGNITVSSKEHSGSTFRVSIPAWTGNLR